MPINVPGTDQERYTRSFTYDGSGNLATVVTTWVDGNVTRTKTFTFVAGVLTTIVVT